MRWRFVGNSSRVRADFLFTLLSVSGSRCRVCELLGIIDSLHLECDFCFFFLILRVWGRMDTDDKTQLLKHLKMYFVFSFTHHVTPCHPLCQLVSEHCVCARVCVCGVFVSLLYESCKMANIHLLYKVSFFSPTITFGFLAFFLHALLRWC